MTPLPADFLIFRKVRIRHRPERPAHPSAERALQRPETGGPHVRPSLRPRNAPNELGRLAEPLRVRAHENPVERLVLEGLEQVGL